MAQKKITELQQISAMTDGSSIPVDNGIQTYRVTGTQLKTYLAPKYIVPSFQKFTSGSGTYYKSRAFVVSGASATVGATYTHNSVTWTVTHTVSSANIVYMWGNGSPLTTGTLTKASGTGDSSISFSEYRDPIFIKVRMVGGGGGGASSGTGSLNNGVTGNASTFGTSLLTANGGSPGTASLDGGAGGTATISAPAYGTALAGGQGGGGQSTGAASATNGGSGGTGGNSYFGGGGAAGKHTSGGVNGSTNTGGGGGGGAGGFIDAIIPSPSATYSYSVAASVSGGVAGSSGFTGGGGAAGYIEVYEHYQ